MPRSQTDTVPDRVGAEGGGETVVGVIVVRGIVIEPHRAAVIVLVKASGVVSYRQTMMDQKPMVGMLPSHLEAVAVSLAGVLG